MASLPSHSPARAPLSSKRASSTNRGSRTSTKRRRSASPKPRTLEPSPTKKRKTVRPSPTPSPATMATPRPHKPDLVEQTKYYHGLAGSPRLIARTSNEEWTLPAHSRIDSGYQGQVSKVYAIVKDPTIISKWIPAVERELIRTLGPSSWTFFFPIRIGLEDDLASSYPTVLLVGVQENTMEWDEGIALALDCRAVLAKFGLGNIEVEIREGDYGPQAASPQIEEKIDTMAWRSNTMKKVNEAALAVLSHPGYPIGYEEGSNAEGTVGLHMRLGDTSGVFALTCRHVVAKHRDPDKSYRAQDTDKSPQYMIQPGRRALEDCLKNLESARDSNLAYLQPLEDQQKRWEEFYQYDETLSHRALNNQQITAMAVYQATDDYSRKVIEAVRELETNDRKIGVLAFHPSLEMSADENGYLKDWALIRLKLDNFTAPPANKILADRSLWPEYPQLLDDDGFIQLHLPEPEVEIKASPFVFKRGPISEFTAGYTNGIEAVVRIQTGLPPQTAKELVVVTTRKGGSKAFSADGDSGSAVFDHAGTVIGIVNGSTINPAQAGLPHPYGTDVTFVTPIQWVLRDIENFTGLKARLAED